MHLIASLQSNAWREGDRRLPRRERVIVSAGTPQLICQRTNGLNNVEGVFTLNGIASSGSEILRHRAEMSRAHDQAFQRDGWILSGWSNIVSTFS